MDRKWSAKKLHLYSQTSKIYVIFIDFTKKTQLFPIRSTDEAAKEREFPTEQIYAGELSQSIVSYFNKGRKRLSGSGTVLSPHVFFIEASHSWGR